MSERKTAEEYMEEEEFEPFTIPSPSGYIFRCQVGVKTYNTLQMIYSSIEGGLKREFGIGLSSVTIKKLRILDDYDANSPSHITRAQIKVKIGTIVTEAPTEKLETFASKALEEGASSITHVSNCNLVDTHP